MTWLPIAISFSSLAVSVGTYFRAQWRAREQGRVGVELVQARRERDSAESWFLIRTEQARVLRAHGLEERSVKQLQRSIRWAKEGGVLRGLVADLEVKWIKLGGLAVDDSWHEKNRAGFESSGPQLDEFIAKAIEYDLLDERHNQITLDLMLMVGELSDEGS